MKIFIPTIGTKLKLTKKWNFTLYTDPRNITLFKHLDIPFVPKNFMCTYEVSLPRNTLLTIDRIYIRGTTSNSRNFDTITFKMKSCDNISRVRLTLPQRTWHSTTSESGLIAVKTIIRPIRFWVKLIDVNNIYGKFR